MATQTFAPTSGTDGRVKNATGDVILSGISKWRRQSKAAVIPIAHFESSADATTGLVQPNKLLGLGDNQVMIEGIYNTNAVAATETGNTGITNGEYVTVDLLISKTLGKGYQDVTGWISDFQVGQEIENQACKFTCTLDVDGVFPTYGTVS